MVSGSSTVEPISTAVGEKLLDCSGIAVTVDGPGTGDGFELFCAGETDISDASRPIDEEEVAACEEAGIEYIELKVAFDGISVLTNPANDRRVPELRRPVRLIGPESEGVDNWSDAQALATELGSATEFPDADLDDHGSRRGVRHLRQLHRDRLRRHHRGAARGRRDHRGPGRDQPARLRVAGRRQRRSSRTSRPSDTSLGWVGFAFAEEAGDQVKEIAVAAEAGGDCVEPRAETIADGDYPICRLAVHLREQGQGRGEPGRGRLRRLLPRRGHRRRRRGRATSTCRTTSCRRHRRRLGGPHRRHHGGVGRPDASRGRPDLPEAGPGNPPTLVPARLTSPRGTPDVRCLRAAARAHPRRPPRRPAPGPHRADRQVASSPPPPPSRS